MDDQEARKRVERIESALERVERLPSGPRETALEAVTALLELYGEGWRRALSLVEAADPRAVGRLARDEVVGHLMMIHDLHPSGLEERVRGALEELRPYLQSHGHGVSLLAVEQGVARLRLSGSGTGLSPATATLRETVEQAVHGAAPELEGVEAEVPPAPAPPPELVQIQMKRPNADGETPRRRGE